jgi:hypothetical protein
MRRGPPPSRASIRLGPSALKRALCSLDFPGDRAGAYEDVAVYLDNAAMGSLFCSGGVWTSVEQVMEEGRSAANSYARRTVAGAPTQALCIIV